MSTPNPEHASPAIGEYRKQMVETELAQEKRDHENTRRQLAAAMTRIDGFERITKCLSEHVDKQNTLMADAALKISQALDLLDSAKEPEVDQ
jgi:hypothetical protein